MHLLNCFLLGSLPKTRPVPKYALSFRIHQFEIKSFFSDLMELKRMMEKLGQAKTHLELKKMIAEVDTRNSGTFCLIQFLSQGPRIDF